MPITGDKDGQENVPTHEKTKQENNSYLKHPQNAFVLKASTNNLTLLSKFIADIKTQYHVLDSSKILVNPEQQIYFVYVTLSNDELAEKLQEIAEAL